MTSINEMYLLITPFCGVCQSVQRPMTILSETLGMKLTIISLYKAEERFQNIPFKQMPAIVITKNRDIIFYTEQITNIPDLYRRILKVCEE